MTYDGTDPDDDGTVEANVDNQSVNTEELSGDWDTLVRTSDDLVSTLANLADDEVVQLTGGTHTISDWLDIDGVSGATVRGLEDSTTVKVADGANVGGFRLGKSSAASDVVVKNISFDGNYTNQTSGTRHHAFTADANATDCVFINCFATRTHPYHSHNDGGSGWTCRDGSQDITIKNCESDEIGDRSVQLAGSGHEVINHKTRNGFDRSVAFDVQQPDGAFYGADNVTVQGGDFKDNVEGSFIAVREYGATDITVRDCKMRGQFRGCVQADNSGCSDWHISNIDAKHTDTDNNQPAFILESGSSLTGTKAVEDAPNGWSAVIVVKGDDVTVDAPHIDIRNTDQQSDVIFASSSDARLELTGGLIRAGSHGSCINLYAGSDHSVRDVTLDEFGDGGGVGLGVRINSPNCHVSGCTGLTASTPRAFVGWDDASGVCHGNYDRSDAATHFDFANAPDYKADNTP